ncbi:acetylcholine receptor subunit alpha-type acr-5-like [Anneissia japonica]|uniref:acetylcholine receptor subunit alpha-type acr-5-like n=1 Tax=Anneissia japonica TaxID=1529436 RepID=UPI0014254D02|nr:acetylcholine receptor subunit alpha-type acr-5-like [Anneissia japonica]
MVGADALNNEARLVKDLLDNYPEEKSARPVLNDSDVVVVTYGYTVTQVVKLLSIFRIQYSDSDVDGLVVFQDEILQTITVNGWMLQIWQDQFMVWNASDYGGINRIKVPSHLIWMPDIILYNNVDKDFERTRTNVLLSITSNGTVVKTTPAIYTAFCKLDVKYFPFDKQECGEKMSFAITNLLAIVLFQQLIGETLPPSDEAPYIANFITLIISLGCISVVATSVILKFHYGRHKKPVNGFIHRIFVRGLGSVLGVYEPDSDRQLMRSKRGELANYCPKMNADRSDNKESIMPPRQGSTITTENANIRNFKQQFDEQGKEDELSKTWTDLALVFDRVMLILCMLVFLITSGTIAAMIMQN